MGLIFAVIDDLYRFAVGALFSRSRDHVHVGRIDDEIIYVVPRDERLYLPEKLPEAPQAPLPHARANLVHEPLLTLPPRHTVAYSATVQAPLRVSPHIGSDTILARVPYGAMVVALEEKDGWVHVFHAGHEGYMSLHDLTDKAGYVLPVFAIGERYTIDDPETERVRAVIEDEFSYGEGTSDLMPEEYVLYKLTRAGVKVLWPKTRPRTPGTWQSLFAQSAQVTAGGTPRVRSVLEWQKPQEHLAFVEEVFDDGSVKISEIGWPQTGVYNERILTKNEYEKSSATVLTLV
jgi:hypothetical protein